MRVIPHTSKNVGPTLKDDARRMPVQRDASAMAEFAAILFALSALAAPFNFAPTETIDTAKIANRMIRFISLPPCILGNCFPRVKVIGRHGADL
jgi:hypothetical protein